MTELGLSHQQLYVKQLGQEFLLRTLYFIEFSKLPDPISEMQAFAERVRTHAERAGKGVGEDAAVIELQEYLNNFFEIVVQELRKPAI